MLCVWLDRITRAIKKRTEQDDLWEKLQEHTGMRIAVLIGAGFFGLFLSTLGFRWTVCALNKIFTYSYFTPEGLSRIQFTVGTIPVILAVWYFRDYDRKATLKTSKAQVSINKSQFEKSKLDKALSDLNSDQPAKIDIGVARLIDMHKADKTLCKRIWQPFITRLKTCPLDKETLRTGSIRLHYAQPILLWLTDNMSDNKEIDLSDSNFACQDFTKDIPFARLFGTTEKRRHVSFQWAIWYNDSTWGADFAGVILLGADLRNAVLENANLQNAKLYITDLQNANLGNADLRGADLQDANLQDVILHGANLEDAYIRTDSLKGISKIGVDTTGVLWVTARTERYPTHSQPKKDKE